MTLVQEKKLEAEAKKLKNKLAVVTGGSRGIGARLRCASLPTGYCSISYNSNKAAADKVVHRSKDLEQKLSRSKPMLVKAGQRPFIAEIKKLARSTSWSTMLQFSKAHRSIS